MSPPRCCNASMLFASMLTARRRRREKRGGTAMAARTRQTAPALDIDLLDGGRWRLADAKPPAFTLIVVYRGLHCPICKTYLADLESKLPEFQKRGVEVIALSTDSRERAEQSRTEWGLNRLRLGYELP